MSDPSLSDPITLVLPDGQAIERVRLYEREQLDSGLWMYRIGVPLWQGPAVGGQGADRAGAGVAAVGDAEGLHGGYSATATARPGRCT
ncbi:hypothetical protein ABZY81_29720 [Streptomyces sp. NPDC006514]|uniref:hypothetical protein n=1 Tax=Streptomyces sp. NPDC006514 TaxID=3154308 RepID=UPI0033BD3F2C